MNLRCVSCGHIGDQTKFQPNTIATKCPECGSTGTFVMLEEEENEEIE